MTTNALQNAGKTLWTKGEYLQSIEIFEEAIQLAPDELNNYWYLGLSYLLQEDEETAQLIWLSAIAEQQVEDSESIVQSLVQTLDVESESLCALDKFKEAWIIRQHIREFAPQNLKNLICLVDLSLKLNEFSESSLEEYGVIELLHDKLASVDPLILVPVLVKVLDFPSEEALKFAEACVSHFPSLQQWTEIVNIAASDLAFKRRLIPFAIVLIKLCLQYDENNLAALGYLPRFYIECQQFTEAVTEAKNFCQRCTTQETRFFSTCVLFQSLMRAGDWEEIPLVSSQLKLIVSELIKEQSTDLSLYSIRFLVVITSLFLYLKDDIVENRRIQNQAGTLFLNNLKKNAPHAFKALPQKAKDPTERLKIGYISNTFRVHSVGWLCRWLFQYHNRDKFEIFIYHVNQRPGNDFFESWFAPKVDSVKYLPNEVGQCAEIIRNDEIDILVDLDSITLDQTCNIMALKPAPIQATWLGYDASGIPSIDYFIADPHVLAHDAQDYYQEKILRLPATYIAVDGFEVGIPSIKRSDFDIPENSIIYWSSQAGPKRNPDTIRLQLQILKQVSNSYFLIKGVGNQSIICDVFISIANELGIESDRLKFLPIMPDEYTHRANLQIADIVLDTYPYNGATTTLETLWAGIPLVTRVGQQFSARNSYTFLMNVGVTEGIAWSDEEYIEWGVRLGQDEKLRQSVAWKLKQSRHTSPLWNAKQFTLEMEAAYRQMYSKFVESQATVSNLHL
jgi:predicted O-linked N-acetylglucosamine transferase (SPINDLY family)